MRYWLLVAKNTGLAHCSLVSDLGGLVPAMGAMRVVVAAARVAAGEVVVGALVPILVPVGGLVQVAVLLLLLVAVGAALLLLLVGVGAALLLLLAADGRGAALHLAAESQQVIRLENGIVALLISAERTRSSRVPGETNRLSESSRGESGEDSEEEETTEGTSEDAGATSEDGDHVTSLSEDDTDVPSKASATGSHGLRRKKDQSIVAACAVCVGVGSFSDPNDVPGLAHLLEHMVFMGSEKYPGENSFDTFTAKHGGYGNACTGCEKTVFEFCIHQPYFREALDRFAQFFVSPQLLEGSLDREIEAVDNEFQDAFQSDKNRIEQLFGSCIANPSHPASKFMWGNTELLKKTPKKKGINVGKHLRDFHLHSYSSNHMTVAVMSRDPLDTLEAWTRESFSSVPSRQPSPTSVPSGIPAFEDALFCRLYKVVPVKDIQEVHITWLLPSLMNQYRIKPMHYLGWLLGHEGKGSVLSLLKKRHLATTLVSGNGGESYEYNSSYSLFTCTITLTNKGLENVLECINVVFQYLKILRDLGPQEWIYREIQVVEENEFNFKDEDDPVDCVSALCESMQYFPEEDYLTGDDLMFQYDHQSIAAVQDLLTPERANIVLVSKTFAPLCDRKEQWFGTKFSSEEIPSDWTAGWQNLPINPDLHLPSPNIFIATDFTLKTCISPLQKYPVVVEECDHYKLWFRQDSVFLVPRAYVHMLFRTAVHLESARNAFMMDLFLHLMKTLVGEVAYAADVAQLHYSFSAEVQGMVLCLDGLNHKLPLLLETLINFVADFSASEEQFQTTKDDVTRNLQNYLLRPKKYAKSLRLKILQHKYWSAADALSIVDSVTLKELTEFVDTLRQQMYVEALVQGNMTSEEAKQLMKYLCSRLQFSPLPMSLYDQLQPRTVQLPANTHITVEAMSKDKQSPSTVIVDYFQCAPRSLTESVMLQLLMRCINEPCFDTLRTKKQLGYDVFCTDHDTFGIIGASLTLCTHGSKYSAEYACGCIDQFFEDFLNILSSWTESDFHSHVDSLIQRKLEPDICLEEEVNRNWSEILFQLYRFDRLVKEVEVLRHVTQEGMVEWYQRYILPHPKHRRLTIKVVSHHTTAVLDSGDKKLESSVDSPMAVLLKEEEVEAFKQNCPLYPRGEKGGD
ncbi:hypothetical protein EMCRGX_G019194 [Ephydatia muelleri]